MGDAIAIQLGGRRFEIGPLTFRQLRDIEAALKGGAPGRLDFDIAVDVIAAALSRRDPQMDRDAILELEGTAEEIATATRAVLRWGGYLARGEPNSGEAHAGT